MDNLKKFFWGKREKKKTSPTGLSDLTTSTEALQIKNMLSVCRELEIPPLNLNKYKIGLDVIKLIPESLTRTYKLLPLAKLGNVLTVAISDPFDIVAIDNIKAITKLEIHLVLATALQLSRAIDEYYSAFNLENILVEQKAFAEAGIKVETVGIEEKGKIDIREITELSQKTQIIEIVNNILVEALNQRASDIHIEPYPDTLRIRYRIDGILQERTPVVDKKLQDAIIARLKIISKLDITQRRLPQDGRISLSVASRDVDLRVSILPLVTGEKVVLRILEKGSLQIDLEKLGFSHYALEAFKKAALKPHGMILITGPTGSGKSTSLYAILSRLNNTEKHLITIEDPVEYQMKGVTQIQVKQEIGLSFASILRSTLRQSPDIVMVGEIRDFETVDIAIKAALTGHLILSTLHTNDAPSAIVRLMNMEVEPFLIASTLTLIAAQRLCRRICPKCKESYEDSVANLSGLPKDFKETKAFLYRGKGCQYCNNSGYFGRVAIVEALIIDEKLRQLILERATLTKIREYARSQGMKTLREDAIEKCLAGEIPLAEALRVTTEE